MRFAPTGGALPARAFLMMTLLALAAVAVAQEIPVVRFSVKEFRVEGDNPLSAAETRTALAPFLGEHEGLDGLIAAAAELEGRIAERGFSFYRVILPKQTLREGVVELRVLAWQVGAINVEGNEHFSDENILATLPSLRVGEAPRTKRLSRERYVANQHASKQIQLRFKESGLEGMLDANVRVEDSAPFNVFLALNNIGTDETGKVRATVGAQHSNLFGRDHSLTVAYTTSPREQRDVRQYGINYAVPLYRLGGTVAAFFTKSDVDTGQVAEFFDVSGAGQFIGLGYTQYLPSLGAYTHSAFFGIEDRLFENDVRFIGQPIGVDVRSRPVALGYQGAYGLEAGIVAGYATYFRNTGAGAKNNDFTYAASRAGADEGWDAFRFGANVDYALPKDWLVRARLDGQWSDEPLISGEQFGVGGARSVRGYEERTVAGDSGFAASIELWAPTLPNDARFIGFLDAGHRRNKNPQPGEQKSDALSSVGIGFRWFYQSTAVLEADLARTLNEAGGIDSGHYKAHVSLLIRY